MRASLMMVGLLLLPDLLARAFGVADDDPVGAM